jgi:hypothetical protein
LSSWTHCALCALEIDVEVLDAERVGRAVVARETGNTGSGEGRGLEVAVVAGGVRCPVAHVPVKGLTVVRQELVATCNDRVNVNCRFGIA